MDEFMKNFIKEYSDIFFDEFIVSYIRKNGEKLFPELEKNLCLEHYNTIHKTNLNENDTELNPIECWVCKAIKDRL